MTSLSQLRAQLELHFQPLACDCSLNGEASLTVRLYDRDSGRVDLVVSGLKLQNLRTAEQVAALIEELRDELNNNHLGQRSAPASAREDGTL